MGNDRQQTSSPLDRKPLTNKQLRDREFFRRTPQQGRVTRDEQLSRNSEGENRQWDIDQCIVEGCPIWELRNPRSILGKEAPKLHAGKEAARKAKRAASQKAARKRKAEAKAAIKKFVQSIKDATDALGPPRSLEEILDQAE